MAVYCKVYMELINALCRQNVELLNIKVGSTYSCHYGSLGDLVYK